MKKIVAITMAAIMGIGLFSLVGCGKNSNKPKTPVEVRVSVHGWSGEAALENKLYVNGSLEKTWYGKSNDFRSQTKSISLAEGDDVKVEVTLSNLLGAKQGSASGSRTVSSSNINQKEMLIIAE